jgi:hypothetical protein
LKDALAHEEHSRIEEDAVCNVLEGDEALKAQLSTCRIPLDHLRLEKVIGAGAHSTLYYYALYYYTPPLTTFFWRK